MNELAEQREQLKRWNQSREAAEQKGFEKFNKYREQFHKPLVIKSVCRISDVGEKCKVIPSEAHCFHCEHWLR